MENLAKYIDHTFLKPNGAPKDIAKLCREARKYGFASVCVHPCEVTRCARLLKGTDVAVCTVIGFPLGQNTPETILAEAVEAVGNGARELDFVINVAHLKVAAAKGTASREYQAMLGVWTTVNETLARLGGRIVSKLILECCYLTDAEKIVACRMAKAAGFDFVKTSTGFGPGGAMVSDVRLMRQAVGPRMGVKAAGGIRTVNDARAMIAAGATRLGCSAGVALVTGGRA
ncbi:MAG: deoxyribose-phosphate aldolase [Kiritimatiellia bacterium]